MKDSMTILAPTLSSSIDHQKMSNLKPNRSRFMINDILAGSAAAAAAVEAANAAAAAVFYKQQQHQQLSMQSSPLEPSSPNSHQQSPNSGSNTETVHHSLLPPPLTHIAHPTHPVVNLVHHPIHQPVINTSHHPQLVNHPNSHPHSLPHLHHSHGHPNLHQHNHHHHHLHQQTQSGGINAAINSPLPPATTAVSTNAVFGSTAAAVAAAAAAHKLHFPVGATQTGSNGLNVAAHYAAAVQQHYAARAAAAAAAVASADRNHQSELEDSNDYPDNEECDSENGSNGHQDDRSVCSNGEVSLCLL